MGHCAMVCMDRDVPITGYNKDLDHVYFHNFDDNAKIDYMEKNKKRKHPKTLRQTLNAEDGVKREDFDFDKYEA